MKNLMTSRCRTSLNRVFLALLSIGFVTSYAHSQTTPSLSLRLSVIDTRGSAVSGATVVLKRKGIRHEMSAVTTDNGTATFLNLEPGTNQVTVTARGFAALEQSVTVSVDRTNHVTLTIEPIPIESSITKPEERAATESGDAPKAGAVADDACASDITCKVKSLQLPFAGRFFRALQYEYKIIEQPGTVLVSDPPGASVRPVRNLQDNLQQSTLTLKFAELFPDRLSLFKRASDYLNKESSPYPTDADAQLSEFLCGKNRPLITCLTKGGGWLQRFLMGISGNVSLGERILVQQGFLVTDPKFGKKYQVNGGFTFDPAKLFPNASNWRSTFEEVQKVDKAVALLGASDAEQRPWKQSLLAALFPKVEFKRVSQFDFVKDNGVLVEAPFPRHALNTWTFTWDLTRVIPDTKNRIDEDAIIDALAGMGKEKDPPMRQCILHLADGDRLFKVKNGFTANSCDRLAKMLNAKSCEYLDPSPSGEPSSTTFCKVKPE